MALEPAGPKNPPTSSPTTEEGLDGTAADQLLKLVREEVDEVEGAQLVPIPRVSW